MLCTLRPFQLIATTAGAHSDVRTIDQGLWSNANAEHCEDLEIDAFIATGRLPHGQPETANETGAFPQRRR